MILTNLFKKKDIPFYLFVALIYLYNIRSIAFPKNFQQDDISELFIEKYYELSCVINAGDNHPLWTFTIWLISRLNKCFHCVAEECMVAKILSFVFIIAKTLSSTSNFQ